MAVGKNITCKKGNGKHYHLIIIKAVGKNIKWGKGAEILRGEYRDFKEWIIMEVRRISSYRKLNTPLLGP